MNITALTGAFLLSVLAGPGAALQTEKWSANFSAKKPHAAAKKLPGIVHSGLDFAAYQFALDGKPCLAVMLRNGHHKMGAASISFKSIDTVARIEVMRIVIVKPMSLITGKPDGDHVFDTFMEKGNSYKILYHIKGGQLESRITIIKESDNE